MKADRNALEEKVLGAPCYDRKPKPKRNQVTVAVMGRGGLAAYVSTQCGDVMSVGLQGYRRRQFLHWKYYKYANLYYTSSSPYLTVLCILWGNTKKHKAEPCVCNTVQVHAYLSLNF